MSVHVNLHTGYIYCAGKKQDGTHCNMRVPRDGDLCFRHKIKKPQPRRTDAPYLLARVEKLEGLLKQMKPTSRMCWCEPSRDIDRNGHQIKCDEARTLLAGEESKHEQ